MWLEYLQVSVGEGVHFEDQRLDALTDAMGADLTAWSRARFERLRQEQPLQALDWVRRCCLRAPRNVSIASCYVDVLSRHYFPWHALMEADYTMLHGHPVGRRTWPGKLLRGTCMSAIDAGVPEVAERLAQRLRAGAIPGVRHRLDELTTRDLATDPRVTLSRYVDARVNRNLVSVNRA